MGQFLTTGLRVPTDKRFLDMVRVYIRKLAYIAGLSDLEVRRLELAAEEAFMNTLEHAYPDGSLGDIFIKAEISETELTLSIRDEGLPFDKSPESYPPPEFAVESPEQGLGFRLIRSAVDEAHFENLGRKGKVLRMVKRLSRSFESEQDVISRTAELAPDQNYVIRPMEPEEAIQVAQLFWAAYGYSYKNEDFYRPEGLLHLIGTGRVISYVAVAENGDVVGHGGLLSHGPVPMAEEALLVVDPAHRSRGIMEMIHSALQEKAVNMQLKGVSVDPVTSHIISQRKIIQLGGRPCGIDLAACPPRVFKGLANEDENPQRESYLHCFNYLTTPSPIKIYVPEYHQAMISKIYENMGQVHTFGKPSPGKLEGDFQVNYDKTLLKGEIKVLKSNEHQWLEIIRVADDLAEFAGAEVVVIDLPVSQPASILLAELAEDSGFFFGGIRPQEAYDGDYFRLQRLHVPLDISRLTIYSDLGNELLKYVDQSMKRA
ncbi:MAG: ATP-binding protein [Methanobacteriaceae archaeon]|nr:ATP-binding protein [Methanobacteriaceae archaeon]